MPKAGPHRTIETLESHKAGGKRLDVPPAFSFRLFHQNTLTRKVSGDGLSESRYRRRNRPVKATIYVILFPVLWPLSLWATWIAARLELGHWPRGGVDDPKSLGVLVNIFAFLAELLSSYGLTLPLAMVLYLIWCSAAEDDPGKRRRLLVVSGAGFALTLASGGIIAWDPHDICGWLLD
jgi:hypothetical protein